MLGTLPALGNWQPEQALRLTRLDSPHWQAEASVQRGFSRPCACIAVLEEVSCPATPVSLPAAPQVRRCIVLGVPLCHGMMHPSSGHVLGFVLPNAK